MSASLRILIIVVLLTHCFRGNLAEFVYYDFNGTTGIIMNGDAATSSCARVARNEYSSRTGKGDVREASLDVIYHQQLEKVMTETSETENHSTSGRIRVESAMVGHRASFAASEEDRCAVRLRLTPSQPHKVASAWYSEALPVLQGFETRFTFQITDQTKRCFEVKDEDFAVRHYQSCMVHGGDGFAFVLHSHQNKTATVGHKEAPTHVSSHMGFEGIENSIAIEFDTWYNTEHEDIMNDHVTIYSKGQRPNSMERSAQLSAAALHDLADGRVHIVKVRYYNEIKLEYLSYLTATANTLDYIKDVSEGRRMGTLLVFMDDGIDKDEPLLAIPINLAATLRLDADEAFIGFTASTGRSWQKHDILGWYYCTHPPCMDQYGQEMKFEFDYNQQSMVSTASHQKDIYPIYIYPDTTPWAREQAYFADGQQIGLVS